MLMLPGILIIKSGTRADDRDIPPEINKSGREKLKSGRI
jgi:hypothetical protein